MPHFFNHIVVSEKHDIPNWILDEYGRFTLKLFRIFFSRKQEFHVVGVNSFGLHLFRLPKL